MPKHTINTEKLSKKATPKDPKIENLDTVEWQIIDSIATNEYLHAVSTDTHLPFDVSGALENKPPLENGFSFTPGLTTRYIPYSLSLVNKTTGTSTQSTMAAAGHFTS